MTRRIEMHGRELAEALDPRLPTAPRAGWIVSRRLLLLLLAGVIVGALAGCEVGPQSGLGLRLPEGDVTRGEQAFSDLGCVDCHALYAGERELDSRVRRENGEVVVMLGGKADHITTPGELFTAIVNPSHGFPRRYAKEDVFEGDHSRMPRLNETMTVAQLIDLTEFLQSKYELDPQLLYGP